MLLKQKEENRESTGPVSFRVALEDGRERQCHQDQLRKMPQDFETQGDSSPMSSDDSWTAEPPTPVAEEVQVEAADTLAAPAAAPAPAETPPVPPTTTDTQATVRKTYPRRIRKPRDIFKPENGFLCACIVYFPFT